MVDCALVDEFTLKGLLAGDHKGDLVTLKPLPAAAAALPSSRRYSESPASRRCPERLQAAGALCRAASRLQSCRLVRSPELAHLSTHGNDGVTVVGAAAVVE